MTTRNRHYSLCLLGLGLFGTAPFVSQPLRSVLVLAGWALAVRYWPRRDSTGSFGRVAFPAAFTLLGVVILFVPLARTGNSFAVTMLIMVRIVSWLMFGLTVVYLGFLWRHGDRLRFAPRPVASSPADETAQR